MVLQYFGSEKDIFAFNRNPKTFVLATIILMVVLRIFMLVLEHAGSLLKFMPWKSTNSQLPPAVKDSPSKIICAASLCVLI